MNNGVFNFFNQIFTRKKVNDPSIKFGRYSDRNKTVEQLQFWKNSLILYSEKKHFQAIENFFKYVKDPEIENLFYEYKNDKILFNFFQGSKQIIGEVDNNILYAYSEIAKYSDFSKDLLKYILETNHNLKFSKFSTNNDVLLIELYIDISHNNPITLYSALRELAITADKYDDLLESKFSNFEPINIGHIRQLPEDEIIIKTKYFYKWIKETLELLNKYDAVKFAGGRSFLLLRLIFRLFFLLSPEGELLQEINNMLSKFYDSDKETDYEKNAEIIRNLEKLANWSENRLKKSLYFVYSTFPVAPPVEPKYFINFANKEIDKVHWYADHNYKDIATAISEYVIGYCCYNYGAIPVIREIFDVFWQTMHYEYYSELNFKNLTINKGNIDYMLLNQTFNEINLLSKKNFRSLNFNIKHLNIANFDDFATSFIYEFINLDFTIAN